MESQMDSGLDGRDFHPGWRSSRYGFPMILRIVRAETLGNAKKAAANSRIGMGFIGMSLISDGHACLFQGMKDAHRSRCAP